MTPTTIRSQYKTTAVIDWIELIVTTKMPTQFRYVQARLRTILCLPLDAKDIYVTALNVSSRNDTSSRFAFRVHDQHANHFDQLLRISSELNLACTAEIAAIEIAVDFYRRDDSDLSLHAMTNRLQRGIAAYGSNPRQFDPLIGKNIFLKDSNQLESRMNLRIGNEADDISWQVYLKETDNNQLPIAKNRHRARAEVTLKAPRYTQLRNVERELRKSDYIQ